jgi:NAD(P)-dependent dehydrogenase (short-subunit alcohol dehydrogenase family)
MASEAWAVVTGAGHRLGKSFAATLARNGYAILLHYWSSEAEATLTADELRAQGARVHTCKADLSGSPGISFLFSQVDEVAHPLKVLVNSAAIMRSGDPRTLTVEAWDETLDLNLRAPFLCSREAASRMGQGGLIVNVTDVGARKSWSRFPAYAVSKAGLEALTGILARGFAPKIRVNAIAPGLTLPSNHITDEEWKRLVERLPLRRAGTVDEVASALDFLLKNEYVTGQTLVIDGGYSLLG